MSKNTFLHTRFWQDNYVCDLDPIEKLLFIYAITSPYLGLTGIYEVPIKHVAFETGLDKDMVVKIFSRFEAEKKIVYRNGWLCVVKYPKYQRYSGEKLLIAVDKEINRIPKDILNLFIDCGYPIDTLSIPSRDRDMDRGKESDRETTVEPSDYPPEFSAFWDSYPRKIGKNNAWKAWAKLKPPPDEVLTALEAQKQCDQWQRDGGKYIPHPTTWLNGKRWEDEVEVIEVINLDK